MSAFRRLAAAFAVLALVTGACSTRPDTDGSAAAPTAGNGSGKGAGAEGGRDETRGKKGAEEGKGESEGEGDGSEGGGDGSENPFGSASDSALATASARLREPQPDATREGALVPDYAEVLAASIEGLGKSFRITLTFGGDVPQQMPNKNTYMVTAMAFQMSEDESYAFGAQGTQEGWKAYAGNQKQRSGEQAKRFPGRLQVSGNTIVMTIPWSYVGGARRFRWFSNSTWFSSVANTTHYSYDPVPNQPENRKKPRLAPYPN